MTTAAGDYSLNFATYGDENPFASALFDKVIGGANDAKVASGVFLGTSAHSQNVLFAYTGSNYDGTDIVESKIEVGTAGASDYLYVGCLDSLGTGYLARLSGTLLTLVSVATYAIGGGITSTTEAFSDGDVLSVKCTKGGGSTTTVAVYKNATPVAAVTGDQTAAGALTGTLYAVFGVSPQNTNASTIKSFALDGLATLAPLIMRWKR